MASAPPVGHLYEIAWEVVDAPVSATDGTWLLMGGDDALADALSAEGLDLRRDPAAAAGWIGVIWANGLGVVDGSVADLCRSEEHTSELQSLMRNSYAVFCLK